MNPTLAAGMIDRLRLRYRRFAEGEAHGVSPLYEEIAHHVAGW